MDQIAFHFTDTAHLPWIMDSGQLRPGRTKVGGFPQDDFLWATSNPQGDRTSTAMSPAGLKLIRSGVTDLIRLACRAADFKPFRELVENHPQWAKQQIERLIDAAAAMGQRPDDWLCREHPLPLGQVDRIELKSYSTNRWIEVDPSRVILTKQFPNVVCASMNGTIYGSARLAFPDGNIAYDTFRRVYAQ